MPDIIIPGAPQRLGLRLVAYSPNGGRLGVLPEHLGWEVGLPLNDVSSLRLSYSSSARGSAWLVQPCEVAAEYSADGGAWIEPPNGRFLRIKRGGDGVDRAGTMTCDCPGYAWMLKKIVLYPSLGMVDGKRLFSATSPGAILGTLVSEGQGRGALPGLDVDFDDEHDSAGQAWATTMTLGLEPGVDLMTLLINLAEQGVIDWCMQGRVLRVFNEGTTLAVDRAAGPAPVELRLGRDVTSAPDDATLEDVASAILVVGEDGLRVEVTNPGASMPWGRWEAYQSQGGVSDEGTAQLLGANALERTAGERVQLTRAITPYAARFLPLTNYAPGDYIRAPGDHGVMQSLRVRQVTLTVDASGIIGGNLTLNDRFLERDIRLARQAAGILAGGVSSGGSGADPAPEGSDRVPAAPTGLLISPAAYLDDEGTAHGQITVSWDAVTADVNGTALSVSGYELIGISPPGTGATRVLATTSSTTITYSPLVPKSRWQFGVVAVNGSVRSAVTASAEIVVPDDETPPPDPSTPVVDSRLGVVRVTWDGLTSAGTGMPKDFMRILVMMRDPLVPEDEGDAVEWLERAGTAVVAGLPYGADREFWLTAIDRSGNVSGESDRVVAQTHPLVDTDVIGAVINGATHIIDGTIPANAKITAGTITGGLIQALAIDTGHLSANAVTADKIVAGAIQAGHIAAAAVTADKIAAGTITADKIAAGAITASKLDADAINGKTITGAFIRTAVSGQRIEFAPPGATLPEIRFHSGSGGQASIKAGGTAGTGIEIVGSADSGGRRYTLVQSTSTFEVKYRSSGYSQANGGFLELNEDDAYVGWYGNGVEDENYWYFGDYGLGPRTTHIGRWNHLTAGSRWGILTGRATVGSGLGGMEVTYPASLMTVPNPVVGVKNAVTSLPNFRWCLSNNTNSGFDVDWQVDSSVGGTNYGKEVFWWVFRT